MKEGEKLIPYKKELVAAGNTIVSFLAGAIDMASGGLPIFQAISNWEANRRFEKMKLVLEEVKEKTDENGEALSKITTLLKNPTGKGTVLFYRIIRMSESVEIEDNNVFSHMAKIQAQMIARIAEQDFEKLFSEFSFLLSRLEKLSPQALWLLNDFDNWPQLFTAGGTTTAGVTLSANWATKFSEAYLAKNDRGRTKEIRTRLADIMSELRGSGFIDLDDSKRVKLTQLGADARDRLLTFSS